MVCKAIPSIKIGFLSTKDLLISPRVNKRDKFLNQSALNDVPRESNVIKTIKRYPSEVKTKGNVNNKQRKYF